MKNENNLGKNASVGLGLGVVQAVMAYLFIPHSVESRIHYLLNPSGLIFRYLVVIALWVAVAGFVLKALRMSHPFRNAFYVPLLAQSVAIIATQHSTVTIFAAVTALAYIVSQLVWSGVARSNKATQIVFVLATVVLALYSLAVLNKSV